jgi:hypothetical protein
MRRLYYAEMHSFGLLGGPHVASGDTAVRAHAVAAWGLRGTCGFVSWWPVGDNFFNGFANFSSLGLSSQ